MQQKALCMTEMEELLAADRDGSYSEKILHTLAENEKNIKVQLDRGLSPDIFQQVEAMYLSVQTASEIIEETRKRLHAYQQP